MAGSATISWFFADVKPDLVITQSTSENTNRTGVTACSLTGVAAGAVLLYMSANADDVNTTPTCSVSSSPTLTWTKQADAGAGSSGSAEIYTAVFTAGGNITVTGTWTGWVDGWCSSTLFEIANVEGTLGGANNAASNQSAPSVNLTTTRDNSIIFCVTSDWAAIDGASRAYRDSATEKLYDGAGAGTHYVAYHYYKQTTSATTYTEGLTSPSTMAAGTAVYEIRKSA